MVDLENIMATNLAQIPSQIMPQKGIYTVTVRDSLGCNWD
jgi:hypothetical protein